MLRRVADGPHLEQRRRRSGRIWNFRLAGLRRRPRQEELLDWHGAGCSVMEMSHRGKEFMSILECQGEADLRES